jgi:hypothetical protein
MWAACPRAGSRRFQVGEDGAEQLAQVLQVVEGRRDRLCRPFPDKPCLLVVFVAIVGCSW